MQGGGPLWRTRIYFVTVGQQHSAYVCLACPRGPMERSAAGSVKDLEVGALQRSVVAPALGCQHL